MGRLLACSPDAAQHHAAAGEADGRLIEVHAMPPPPQVRMQREALEAKKKARVGLAKDDERSGDGFVAEAESMVSN